MESEITEWSINIITKLDIINTQRIYENSSNEQNEFNYEQVVFSTIKARSNKIGELLCRKVLDFENGIYNS